MSGTRLKDGETGVAASSLQYRVGDQNLPLTEKGLQNGGPKFLWFTEAPVGIEPTNGGFAVLRELLQAFAFSPNS